MSAALTFPFGSRNSASRSPRATAIGRVRADVVTNTIALVPPIDTLPRLTVEDLSPLRRVTFSPAGSRPWAAGLEVSSGDATGLAFMSAVTTPWTAAPSAAARNGSVSSHLLAAASVRTSLSRAPSRSISTASISSAFTPTSSSVSTSVAGVLSSAVNVRTMSTTTTANTDPIRTAVWRKFMDGRSWPCGPTPPSPLPEGRGSKKAPSLKGGGWGGFLDFDSDAPPAVTPPGGPSTCSRPARRWPSARRSAGATARGSRRSSRGR